MTLPLFDLPPEETPSSQDWIIVKHFADGTEIAYLGYTAKYGHEWQKDDKDRRHPKIYRSHAAAMRGIGMLRQLIRRPTTFQLLIRGI